jgi:putative aminopeptidase FrvX
MLDLADPVAVLRELAGCPTAPFHELRVAARLGLLMQDLGLPVHVDAYGNLLVHYAGGAARPLALVAHMDHPALEVLETAPLTGRLLGGVPLRCLERPVAVRFLLEDREDRKDQEVAGRIVGYFEGEGFVGLRLEAEAPVLAGTFGVFDLEDFREDADGLLYQRAADDLAGCAAIVSVLARCVAERIPATVLGLFTRAEEVGLIGAMLVAQQRLLPPETLVVSLECSRALPSAEIGAGAVIRVGDRTTCFSPEGDLLLQRARDRLRERDPSVRIQRQLMSGGTCEATAFMLAGYTTVGVAFPLGNYHNAGPDDTIAPEYIHRRDLQAGVELLVEAARGMAELPSTDPLAERLACRAAEAAPRLQGTRAAFVQALSLRQRH